MKTQKYPQSLKIVGLLILFTLACGLNRTASTVMPANPPVNFEVQTASPTPNVAQVTATSTPIPQDTPLPLSGEPINPTPTATLVIQPTQTPLSLTDTPIAMEATTIITPTEAAIASEPATEAVATATPAPKFTGELDPPLKGGDWDFEAEFILWENPYGDCSGALVSSGWAAFVQEGEQGSSCMGQNLYAGDVQSGLKSQEITFDFIAASSGIYRTIATKPGHRYQIEAYGKHVHSAAPVQLFLGVEMTGGTVWDAASVQWFPWANPAEDVWVTTTQTVTATGENMTLFLRGFHPQGDQGGKTYFDNVSVTHLGP